jgi:hypothetical protein
MGAGFMARASNDGRGANPHTDLETYTACLDKWCNDEPSSNVAHLLRTLMSNATHSRMHLFRTLNVLNGWQRLWLIASLLWLVGVPALFGASFPTEEKWEMESWVRSNESSSTYKAITEEIQAVCRRRSEQSGELLDYAHCMDANQTSYQSAINRSREEAARVREEANIRIRDVLLTEQIKHVGLAVLIWLVPVGIAYLLGVTAAWVIQGFRSTSK